MRARLCCITCCINMYERGGGGSIAAAEQTFIEVSEIDNRGEGFSAWNENTVAGACVHLLWAIIDSHRVVVLNLIIFSPDKRLHSVSSAAEMDSSTAAAVITEPGRTQGRHQLHVNHKVLHKKTRTQAHSVNTDMFYLSHEREHINTQQVSQCSDQLNITGVQVCRCCGCCGSSHRFWN